MLNGTGLAIDYLIVPASVSEGDSLTLLGRASDSLNSAINYTWNFGDGNSTNGTGLTEPTHAFVANVASTPYTVTLTVTNGTDTEVLTRQVAVANRAPEVNAGPGQFAHAGATVTFAGSATDAGAVTAIEWDFDNDGVTFTPEPAVTGTLTPTHTFANPGTAVVALRATDANGSSAIATTSVGVRNSTALLATAGADLDVTVGQATSFAGSYLFPGGTVSSSGIEWDFDYDGTFNADSTGSLTPNFTFADEGTFVVALRITGDNGSVELRTLEVTAAYNYVGPTASAGNDVTVNQGAQTSFSGSYSDPDGTVNSSDIAWDFAYDGTTFVADATGSLNATWTPLASGTFLVALRVTDNHGLTSIDTLQVVVNNVAPTVAMNGVTVTVGGTAPLSATVSDPGGAGDPLLVEWDLDYDGTTFTPLQTTGDSLSHTFTQAGTFLAAVRATDSAGESTLQTFGITVNSASTLVVIAGPDQSVLQGTAVAFGASYTTPGTVDVNTVEWDFDYDGTFNADASGTLTPTHTFNTPDTYVVAVRMTDSNQVTNLGVLHVAVANGAPEVDAGADATVPEGGSVTFAGTATDLGGAGQIVFIEWDYDYNGGLFTADSSGSLTPTYTFTDAGEYTVALRVTDVSLSSTIQTLNVTVTPVAPSVSALQMGPAAEGSPATFGAFISGDPDPNETFDVYVSWAPGAAFEYVGAAGLLGMGFEHTFADSTPAGGVTATVRVVDGDGATAEGTFTVTVDNVAPTATLSASGGATLVADGVPILFTDVSDVSPADAAAGFTYYHRLNNGDWVSDDVPEFLLPDYLNGLTYLIEGYVVDQDGGQSATSSTTVTTPPSGSGSGQTIVANRGGGTVILEDGKVIGPDQYYLYEGLDSYIGVTLQTGGATYDLYTNGQFDLVNALAGGVDVGVFTNVAVSAFAAGLSRATGSAEWSATSSVAFYGSGHIGDVVLGGGGSVLEVGSRGDLANVTGPGGPGVLNARAADLIFSNLTGSITALDRIQSIQASGWLGDEISDAVWANEGIGTLLAYGVAATVTADRNSNSNGLATTATIREGGITGLVGLGTALAVNVNGPVNALHIWNQVGDFIKQGAGDVMLLTVALTQAVAPPRIHLKTGNLNDSVMGDVKYEFIYVDNGWMRLSVQNNLTVGGLYVEAIRKLDVGGNLRASSIVTNVGGIENDGITVTEDLTAEQIRSAAGIKLIEVGKNIRVTEDISAVEDIEAINAKGQLHAGIHTLGDVTAITAGNKFLPGRDGVLVKALGTIGTITVKNDDLGNKNGSTLDGSIGKITATGIGWITVGSTMPLKRGNLVAQVRVLSGGIGHVNVTGTITGELLTQGGDIRTVVATSFSGTIRATRRQSNFTGGNIGIVYLGSGGGTIHADRRLGSVTTTEDVISRLFIIAQSGGSFNPDGSLFVGPQQQATPLRILAIGGFQGRVRFTYGTAPTQYRIGFAAEDPLLKLTQYSGVMTKEQTWKVYRLPGGTELSVNLLDVSFGYRPNRGPYEVLGGGKFTKPGTDDLSTQWTVE